MMCQLVHLFINFNKHTTLVEDVGSWGEHACVGIDIYKMFCIFYSSLTGIINCSKYKVYFRG